MKEILEIISSLSVLIASIAGALAVSKWRAERFERSKIEAFEKCEKSFSKMRFKAKEIEGKGVYLVPDMLEEDDKKSLGFYFYNLKNKEMEELDFLYNEMELALEDYKGYVGYGDLICFEYFKGFYLVMINCLHNFVYEDIDINENGSGRFVDEIIFNYLNSGDSVVADEIEYPKLFRKDAEFTEVFKDFRTEYHELVCEIIRFRKLQLHSGLLRKIVLGIKIFYLECDISGRVLLMGKEEAIVVLQSGSVIKMPSMGCSIEDLEKKLRSKLYLKMTKRKNPKI